MKQPTKVHNRYLIFGLILIFIIITSIVIATSIFLYKNHKIHEDINHPVIYYQTINQNIGLYYDSEDMGLIPEPNTNRRQ